jgi:hypothetical protein
MGLEPTTFCMASRRSSQLSYIRESRSIAAVYPGLGRRTATDSGSTGRSAERAQAEGATPKPP